MEKLLSRCTRACFCLLFVCFVCALSACGGTGTPVDTADVPTTAATEAVTASATDASTERLTETPTEAATVPETEPETEPETDDPNKPVPAPIVFDCEGAPVKSLLICGVEADSFTVIYPAAADSMPDDDEDEGYDATIVADKTAAVQLAKYLSLAIGKTIEVKPDSGSYDHEIAVGHTDRDTDTVRALREGLGGDGYLLLCEDGRLYISGETDRGTPNGVFSFLDEWIGWRFFTQTLEKVLPADRIDIPETLRFTYIPPIEWRTTSWLTACINSDDASDDLNASFFGAKSKINTSNDARQLGELGGSFPKAASGDHNLGRLSGTGDGLSSQPCFSDEDILYAVYKSAKKEIKNCEGCTTVVISQNDSDTFCRCADCRKLYEEYGYSGALIYFLNRVYEKLDQAGYGYIQIRTLAYGKTLEPPKGDIRPVENIIIMLAPIDSCYSHDINDDTCERNVRYAQYLEQWAQYGNKLYLWDYSTNFSYYLSPFATFSTMLNNAHLYAQCGVRGIYAQGNSKSESGEFGELRTYLVAKLLWQPDMSEETYDKYMDEFLQAYYGEGWKYIREYIDTMCERAKMNHLETSTDPRAAFTLPKDENGVIDFTFVEDMRVLWEKAAAVSGEAYQMHIEKSSIQILFSEMWLKSQTALTNADIQDFAKLLKKHKITWINEGFETSAYNLKLWLPKDTNY